MRIYVSSTSEDLREFRRDIVEQLGRLGHQVVSMEGYSADARGPVEKSLGDVASADAYVGLFAFHYGSGITEMEFQKASELKLPRCIFLVPNDARWDMSFTDFGTEAGVKMARLRQEIQALQARGEFTLTYFRDKAELLKKLPQAIQDIQPRRSFHDLVKPVNFDAERKKHLAHFTGRKWVEAKLDDWISNPKLRNSRVFCLLGGPGIGKSAIACNWSHSREDVVAFHYCVHGDEEKTDPKRILLSLAAQIAAHLPEYDKRVSALDTNELKETLKGGARTIFDNLFVTPLGGNFPSSSHTQLVIIDGLDEASRGQDNELASLLGEIWVGLPDWLRLVVTSRPEMDVSTYLGSLHPFILNAISPENLQDIRAFLRRELDIQTVSDEIINEIVEKSEGMFLYAYLVLDDIRNEELSLREIVNFPTGLNGYYNRWFRRKFPQIETYQHELKKLVSVIVAQKAPLPLSVLSSTLGLRPHELHMHFMKLGVLFPLRDETHGNQKETCVTLMHKSLHDWLTERDLVKPQLKAGAFAADLELGNGLLADEGWKVYSAGRLPQDHYFSQTLLSHLSEGQQTEKLARVLLDPTLLDTLWSNQFRYDWQRYISTLSHTVSLANLVKDWLKTHGSPPEGTTRDAVICGKLGQLFQELGAFDEAVSLVEAALHIWQANNVTDSPDMVASLLALGSIQSVREERDHATGSYERALTIAQRAYPQDSPQMADVLYQLCTFYTKCTRDYKKAWDCVEKSLAIRSRGNPPDSVGLANCINDKAVILMAEGKSADYLGIYREALALFEKARPAGHPEMVATLGNVANELRKQDKKEDAVKTLRRAVMMAENILLPQHEYNTFVRCALSSTLLSMGQYDEALRVIDTQVKELERFPGPDHDDTAEARLQLIQALWNAVHLSDSAKRGGYREEIRLQCQRIHQARPATVLGLTDLAEYSRRVAEQGLRDCLHETAHRGCRGNAEKPHSNPSDSAAAKCFAEVFEALMSSKPFSELAPQIVSLWENAEPQIKHQADCLPKTRKLILSLISWVGRTRLVRDGDIESIHQAFDLISRIGAESPETLDHLASLTVSLHRRHHEEISESLCHRLLEKSEHILGVDHVQTLTYLENLAYLKMHRGKLEDAERLYRRALQGRVNIGGNEQSNTLSTITSLAECLLLQGSIEAAQTLVRELVAKLPVADAFSDARKTLARCLGSTGIELKNEFAAFDASKVCYELSLEIDPKDANAHSLLALLLWVCLHDTATAAEHFEKSLALEPASGNTRSNYAHFLAQTMNDPIQALTHFEKAMSHNPNDSGIPANYAALLLQQGDLAKAWSLSERSWRLCLPTPDRIMARPLFCATALLSLRGQDVSVPLGQLKTLFAHGIDHVPWVLTGTLDVLDRKLTRNLSDLLRALSDAISDKQRLARLEANPAWHEVKAVSFDTPWPELELSKS